LFFPAVAARAFSFIGGGDRRALVHGERPFEKGYSKRMPRDAWRPAVTGIDDDLTGVWALDGAHAWVSGASGGLYRTRDMGERFDRVGAGLPSTRLLALSVSRFFALEPLVFVGTEGAGLYKSTDGGEKFEAVGDDVLGKDTVHALVWWGGLLLVGTDGGLFLSNDGGKKFRKARDLEGRRVLALAVPGAEADVSSDVIVGTDLGVFKSSDGAQRFRKVQEGMGPIEIRALATFPLPAQNRERRRR
jgi:photosystem II stability/assembly factor-like uncharacterized protein